MRVLMACPVEPEFARCRKSLAAYRTGSARGVVHARVANTEVAALRSGLGKARTAARLARFCAEWVPDVLVDTGSCGGLAPGTPVGTVVAAAGCVEFRLPGHRLPRLLRRYERRPTALAALPAGALTPLRDGPGAGTVVVGDIACNEVVVDDAALRESIHRETAAVAATFETAAVGAVAAEYGIPWFSFRVVTDTASGTAALEFARTVARETASLYGRLVQLVECGWFRSVREALGS